MTGRHDQASPGNDSGREDPLDDSEYVNQDPADLERWVKANPEIVKRNREMAAESARRRAARTTTTPAGTSIPAVDR